MGQREKFRVHFMVGLTGQITLYFQDGHTKCKAGPSGSIMAAST